MGAFYRTFPPGLPVAPATGMLIDASFNRLTGKIIAAAIEVRRTLGPGLLESAYAQCLRRELAAQGVRFEAERTIPIVYKGIPLDANFRVDLIVEDLVVVEVKAVDTLAPVHRAQALTYLAMTGCVVGLVINFNVAKLVDGVMRVLAKGAYGERSPTTGPR